MYKHVQPFVELGIPLFHSNNFLASHAQETGGRGAIAFLRLQAACRRPFCIQVAALGDLFRAFPSADSRHQLFGLRREQHHEPGMGQAPAVREAESVQEDRVG